MSVVVAVDRLVIRMHTLIIGVDPQSAPGGTLCPVLMSVVIWMMTLIIGIMTVVAADDRLSIVDCELPVDDR
jgi:hypothetical protein